MWVTAKWVGERIIVVRGGRRAPSDWFRSNSGTPRQVVPVWRDVFLDISDIPAGAKPWELREVVAIARCFAVQESLGRDVPLVFTGECALMLQGLSTWWDVPDVHYRAPIARRRKLALPAVPLGGTVVPAVSAKHIAGSVPRIIGNAPLRAAPPAAIVSDLALTSHPLQVFVSTCSLLAARTRFRRYSLADSRQREVETKAQLLNQLRGAGKRWGSRLAIDTVMAADAGVESPAEAALLWGLHCLLPARKREALKTQHRVLAGEKSYFLDVSLPGILAAIEPDGASKFAREPEVYAAQKNDFIRRNQALASAGWSVGHIPAADLGRTDMLQTIGQVAADVRMLPPDVPVSCKGPLWKPFTGQLFSPQRRF